MLARGFTVGDRAVADYDRDGFVVLRNVFSAKEIEEIEARLRAFIDEEAVHLTGRDINFVDAEKKVLNSIHKLHRTPEGWFTRFLESPEMQSIASAFLKEPAKGRAAELFAKPGGHGLPSPIHQDNMYWCVEPANALTMWIALDPAGPFNGGVSYLKGSQACGPLSHVPSFAPGSSQTLRPDLVPDTLPRETPRLEPGDVLVHHCLTIHWSDANASPQSRRGVTLQYQGASCGIDLELKSRYEKMLESQIAMRSQTKEN